MNTTPTPSEQEARRAFGAIVMSNVPDEEIDERLDAYREAILASREVEADNERNRGLFECSECGRIDETLGPSGMLILCKEHVREPVEADTRLADGAGMIAAERRRQIEREGWSPEHDAEHISGELARAAATYAMPDYVRDLPIIKATLRSIVWPDGYNGQRWDFHPSPDDRVRELVKAGALVAAEIDRILATPAPAPTEDK